MSDEPIDGELEDDEYGAPAADWTEWFSQPGLVGYALREALARAIIMGIQHKVLQIEYDGTDFTVRLPRVWIEQQFGKRLPL